MASTDVPRRPLNIFSLPILKETDKARLGLTDFRLNMPRPANKSRPHASAIIDLQPVYVGEEIPGTGAVLIGVELRGIAIEIPETGERFHIPF